jgi:DNA modification methylase
MVADDSWSFKNATRTETSYLTHSYHRYPAKFIPQLAAKIIKENSQAGDLVCDPFAGSGTALVEAIVNGRRAYGSDINPVAVLIAKAKTTIIEPAKLEHEIDSLFAYLRLAFQNETIHSLLDYDEMRFPVYSHERINYWFPEKQKHDLALVLSRIKTIEDKNIQTFLLCSFSNILKDCSIWMMKSVKPTRDRNKKPADVYESFILQTKRMIKKNAQLWQVLAEQKIDCIVDNSDARNLSLKSNCTSLIVTSPPYVTSYEYADLYQLTALWLGHMTNLKQFRVKFIGSVQKQDDGDKLNLYSKLARVTVEELREKDKKVSIGIKRYFFEMQQCFEEMNRVLKPTGRAAIVIGDTDLKKVKIKNAEIFIQTMEKIGFRTKNIVERPIPSKILPLTRDRKTGRFANKIGADRLAYPTEHILIMEKI